MFLSNKRLQLGRTALIRPLPGPIFFQFSDELSRSEYSSSSHLSHVQQLGVAYDYIDRSSRVRAIQELLVILVTAPDLRFGSVEDDLAFFQYGLEHGKAHRGREMEFRTRKSLSKLF